MFTILLISTMLLIISYYFLRRSKAEWPSPAPPHPPLHPILGNIPTITNNDPIFHLAFHNLALSLGNLFRMNLRQKWVLFVAGFEEMKVREG